MNTFEFEANSDEEASEICEKYKNLWFVKLEVISGGKLTLIKEWL